MTEVRHDLSARAQVGALHRFAFFGRYVILAFIAAMFVTFGFDSSATAETSNTTDFMPKSWSSSISTQTTAPRARRGRSEASAYDDGSRPQRRSRAAQRSTSSSFSFGSLTGGGVAWRASSSCLAGNLHSVIAGVASYGSVTVNSTCRSHSHNRRVGGASKSYHLTGQAADLRVRGNISGAIAYLRANVGGFKHYGGGLFHIDNGPRRSF